MNGLRQARLLFFAIKVDAIPWWRMQGQSWPEMCYHGLQDTAEASMKRAPFYGTGLPRTDGAATGASSDNPI